MAKPEVFALLADEAQFERNELAEAVTWFVHAPTDSGRVREVLERLAESGTALGMDEIALLTDWLGENLAACAAGAGLKGETIKDLFNAWLPPLIQVCRQPGDANALAALEKALRLPQWPRPMEAQRLAAIRGLFQGAKSAPVPAKAAPAPTQAAAPPSPAAKKEQALQPAANLDPRLWDAFLAETPAQVEDLVAAVQGPRGQVPGEQFYTLERLAHSIKGACNLVGVFPIAGLAASLEDLFEILEGRRIDGKLAALLVKAADLLAAQFTVLLGGGGAAPDPAPVVNALRGRIAEFEREEKEKIAAALVEDAPEPEQQTSLRLASDVDPRLLEAFFQETPDLAAQLAALLRSASSGGLTGEQVTQAERLAHTVKGSSALVGLESVQSFAHRLEDVLELLGATPPPQELASLLVEVGDALEGLFDGLLEGQDSAPVDTATLVQRLGDWASALSEVQPGGGAAGPGEGAGITELRVSPDVDPRLLEAFFQETPDLASQLAVLLRSATGGGFTGEQVAQAERLAHTVKGSAALIGCDAIQTLTHRLEDVLELLGAHSPPVELATLLVEIADVLEALFDALLERRPRAPVDCAPLLQGLDDWAAALGGEAPEALEAELEAEPEETAPPSAGGGFTDLRVSPEVDPRLLEAFFQETPDLAANLAALLRTATTGGLIGDQVTQAERLAHTVKGSAALVGLEAIQTFAHRLEDVLELLGASAPPPELAALLVEVGDLLEGLFDALLERRESAPLDTGPLLVRLSEWVAAPTEKAGLGETTVAQNGSLELLPVTPEELLWNEQASPGALDRFFLQAPQQAEELATLLEQKRERGDEGRAQALALIDGLREGAEGVGIAPLVVLLKDLHIIVGAIGEDGISEFGVSTLAEAAQLLRDLMAAVQGMEEPKPDLWERLSLYAQWARRIGGGPAQPAKAAAPKPAPAPVKPNPVAKAAPAKPAAPKPAPPPAAAKPVPPPSAPKPAPSAPAPQAPAEGGEAEATQAGQAVAVGASLRVPTQRIDALMRLVGEMTTAVAQLQGRLQGLQERVSGLYGQSVLTSQRVADLQTLVEVHNVPALLHQTGGAAFDPLEMDQYHELHSITSALAESFSDHQQMARLAEEELIDLGSLAHHQERLSREVNEAVLATRMMPLNGLTPRLERTVREACRATGKQVNLRVLGDDLLADTDIVNGLRDPLMHVLRNSVDHGIEEAAERSAKGKPEAGNITVSYRRQGNTILVRAWDDGGGFHVERIRGKAIERGLERARDLSEAELLRLVLQPGFSTKQQTTTLSGRGIGMDVVRQAVEELRGTMILANRPEGGAEITLRLPLTLVSAPVLLVKSVGQVFAVPSDDVDQLLFPEPGSILRIGVGWSFNHGNKIYPMRALNALLGRQHEDAALSSHGTGPILLVQDELGTQAVALELALIRRDVVVQPLGPWLPNVRGVAGACILADGSVAPILDLRSLLRGEENLLILRGATPPPAGLEAATPAPGAGQAPTILVVDDSLSARQALEIALEQKEYKVATAIDGLDAIRVLDEAHPDLILVDMEMPRMNGLEFTRHVRAQPQTRELPIVMVTSRSTAKHRHSAELAGVTDYMTKPFDNEQLFGVIGRLLKQGARPGATA